MVDLLGDQIVLDLGLLDHLGVQLDVFLGLLVVLPGFGGLDEELDAVKEHVVVGVVVGDLSEEIFKSTNLLGTLNLVSVDTGVLHTGQSPLEVSTTIRALEHVLLEVVPVILDVGSVVEHIEDPDPQLVEVGLLSRLDPHQGKTLTLHLVGSALKFLDTLLVGLGVLGLGG